MASSSQKLDLSNPGITNFLVTKIEDTQYYVKHYRIGTGTGTGPDGEAVTNVADQFECCSLCKDSQLLLLPPPPPETALRRRCRQDLRCHRRRRCAAGRSIDCGRIDAAIQLG